MSNMKEPLLTDDFLDKLAEEINQLYGHPEEKKGEE
jgi:hypothetical protein